MKQAIIFLVAAIALRAQTDLPGPLAALPLPDHSAATAIASWEKTNTYREGFIASNSIAADTYWTLPIANGVAGCWQTNTSNQISIASCGGGLPVTDTTAVTQGASDPTKLMRFSNSGITSGNTRVLSIQDFNYTLAGIDHTETFTADQTFAANILASGVQNIGSAGNSFNNGYISYPFVQDITFLQPGSASVWVNFLGGVTSGSGLGNLSLVNTASQHVFDFVNTGGAISYGRIVPATTTSYDLGSSSLYWNNLYVNAGNFSGNVSALSGSVSANALSSATLTATGSLSVGSAGVVSNLLPNTGSLNLGSSSAFWNTVYNQTNVVEFLVFDDSTPALAYKMGWDSSTGAFDLLAGGAGTKLFDFGLSTGNRSYANLTPSSNLAYDLGSSSNQWNNLWVGNVTASGSVAANALGSTTLTATNSLSVGSNGLVSNLVPHTNLTYNLGSSSIYWNNNYFYNISNYMLMMQGGSATMQLNVNSSTNAAEISTPGGSKNIGFLTNGATTSYQDIDPDTTATRNLGTSSLLWNNVYATTYRTTSSVNGCASWSSGVLGTSSCFNTGAWTNYTPSTTNLTSVVSTGRYNQSGKHVEFTANVIGTTNGSAPTLGLPATVGGFNFSASCFAGTGPAQALVGIVNNGASTMLLSFYNAAAWPSGSAVVFTCSGVYEST